MAVECVRVDLVGNTVMLMLNCPETLNAMNERMITELCEKLRAVEDNGDARALVLTGVGRAFCAGADISQIDRMKSSTVRGRYLLDDLFEQLSRVSVPTIAALHGVALGGGLELALACDIVIAERGCRLGLPEVTLGLIPGAGGTQRLVHAVGKARAMLMLATGSPVLAEEASQWGLVSKVVDDGSLRQVTLEVAAQIARNAPMAVTLAVDSARRAQDASLLPALALERRNFQIVLASEDASEGVAAFIEHRTPAFRGQ